MTPNEYADACDDFRHAARALRAVRRHVEDWPDTTAYVDESRTNLEDAMKLFLIQQAEPEP